MTFNVIGKTAIDASGNVILGTVRDDPGVSTVGTIHFNSTLRVVRAWNGTNWVSLTRTNTNENSIWSWGSNFYTQLGVTGSTTSSRSSPVSILGQGLITDWVQVSAGGRHTMALRTNGTLFGWGGSVTGELGTGASNTSVSSPVTPIGGFADWTEVSAGIYHTLAIRANGTLWGWGKNSDGTIGNGNTTDVNSPVSAVGGFTNWIQVSAGFTGSGGIRADGTAWRWGKNTNGELGTNSITDTTSPVSVVGGFTDWSQISVGKDHAAAVRTNGSVWAWGRNDYGELGDNSITKRSSPVSVVGGFTDWVQVTAGYASTAAVRANGTLWAWGRNDYGKLGDNTTSNRSSPVSVVGGFTDWVQVDMHEFSQHTAAVRTSGSLWTWGRNNYGQLGNNSVTNSSSPVSVVGGFTNWVQVSTGHRNTFGLRVS